MRAAVQLTTHWLPLTPVLVPPDLRQLGQATPGPPPCVTVLAEVESLKDVGKDIPSWRTINLKTRDERQKGC